MDTDIITCPSCKGTDTSPYNPEDNAGLWNGTSRECNDCKAHFKPGSNWHYSGNSSARRLDFEFKAHFYDRELDDDSRPWYQQIGSSRLKIRTTQRTRDALIALGFTPGKPDSRFWAEVKILGKRSPDDISHTTNEGTLCKAFESFEEAHEAFKALSGIGFFAYITNHHEEGEDAFFCPKGTCREEHGKKFGG